MKRILIVDDDVAIGDMVEETLKKEGYLTMRAYSGTEAPLVVASKKPDLILLDLMLPGISGEELLSKIKDIPTIVVSAKLDEDNKVDMLVNGAVDYVTKPFSVKELVARIAIALRNRQTRYSILEYDGLRLELDTHLAFVNEASCKLTKTEFAILKLLMQNPTQVITKSVMLDKISEDTPDCVESSLKVHISNLRKKLRECGDKDYIEAVWGIGFKLSDKS